jgi:flotillin
MTEVEVLANTAVIATGIAVGLFFFIALMRSFLFIGKPNEVLIFSGRQRTLADGSSIGYRELIGGGRAFRIPILEKVDRMDLSTLPVDIQVQNAYSKGGIPLRVHAVANVKVSPNPGLIKNAIERFMGQNISEIRRVAKETLEGHLRGVLATLTPEEVNEDRLKFATALLTEAEEDFEKLGLALDTLKVQNVSDDVKYLDSIGRKRIAEVIRDAEVAESTAIAEAKRVEAEAHRAGEVAVQLSETAIVQRENQLRELKAQLEAEAKSEEETAVAAAQQARAEAEKELQEIRQQLEAVRLQADVVLPAQAQKEASQLQAQGEAASIEENGRASAAVLQMLTDAWLKAGDDAKDIFLIQQLEEVLKTVVDKVNNLEVDHVTLLDGGSGEALPRHVASFPGAVRQVLDELRRSTGVDVTGILSQGAKEVK